MALELTPEEMERRRPLWWALSDLMLDTDMPELWGSHIARIMRQGGWTLADTHDIFLNEVGPAFLFNLLLVAGEWVGWEETFVAQRVLLRLQRPRWWRRCSTRLCRRQMQEIWQHTLPYIEQALSGTAAEATVSEASIH